MDPATLSNLDPKLRETYERVMGTSSTTPNPPSPSTADSPAADKTNGHELSKSLPQSPLTDAGQPGTVSISQPLPNTAPISQISKPAGHSGLIKIFYVLGATVFFVIYVFFWMKIFNFNLPF